MVNNCNNLIYYVNIKHDPIDTNLTINYAKRKDLEIINLYNKQKEPTYSITKEWKKVIINNLFAKYKK